jgi:HPt (histidine-containing phosphotransfer) domain-containing protein
MKGIAGSIGAHSLQHHAARLEQALQREEPEPLEPLELLLIEFARHLRAVCSGIEEAFATDAGPSLASTLPLGDVDQLLVLLRELAPSVQRRKPKPAAEIMARMQEFRWPRHERAIDELDRAIKKYQFKEAQALIEELVATLRDPRGEKE